YVICQEMPLLQELQTLKLLGKNLNYFKKPIKNGQFSRILQPAKSSVPALAQWATQDLISIMLPRGTLIGKDRKTFGVPVMAILSLFGACFYHCSFFFSLLKKFRWFPFILCLRTFKICLGVGLFSGLFLKFSSSFLREWFLSFFILLMFFFFYLGMHINSVSDYIKIQLRK
uniref:3-oxo-5-alpha-steroid 4-dehydrogenase C-terminal domain-containing protein n=1 Tax=Sus scrofa TaxID=9823 RepID=A0A4X1TC27_PIG